SKVSGKGGNQHYKNVGLEPGEMEAECASSGTKAVLTKILSYISPAPFMVPKYKGFTSDHPATFPVLLSEEYFCYYTSKFQKTGFT
ncbi:hypothetical protein MKX03_024176, partial [Papaver bracteatum]